MGDQVRAFNERGGKSFLKARVKRFRLPPGVVAARLDWARFGPGDRNINVLYLKKKLTDMGKRGDVLFRLC